MPTQVYRTKENITPGMRVRNIHTQEVVKITAIEDVEGNPKDIRVYVLGEERWCANDFFAHWRLMRTSTESY